MARMMFGGGPEDVFLRADEDGDLQAGGGATVLFYSGESVGTNPITDLLSISLAPITSVTTSTGSDGRAPGQLAPFYGPDDVYEMWASAAGSPRFLLQASNLGSVLGPIGDQYLQHAALPNAHGTGLQNLTNVSIPAPANGQALIYQSSSGLWVAGTVAGGGGGGTGDATLAGAQTFTGAKTFTGGVTERPVSISTAARTVQSLTGQTGNVEEWRDGAGALKAWMTPTFAVHAPNLSQTVAFARAGALTTGAGTMRFYNDRSVPLTILSIRINTGTPSTSGLPTVDINIDGGTIYTTQGNRPSIAVGALTSGKNTGFATSVLPVGSYLTADVDLAGAGASDLVVQIELN
jgi:hypothetical protein